MEYILILDQDLYDLIPFDSIIVIKYLFFYLKI